MFGVKGNKLKLNEENERLYLSISINGSGVRDQSPTLYSLRLNGAPSSTSS